ncbi:MAG TPA: YraN family protein [Chitinophagaceae bacterium]|jgi:putative endonuclease|nr:YraN family protein [Chitinophagaceae bacterium]
MALHNEIGKKGEEMAVLYLKEKGYDILHRNWRYSHYEIDVIAVKETKLHIVEVKLRSSKAFGFPEENVTKKKFRALLNAADEFLHQHPEYRHVQYDILSINLHKNREPEYFLLEDVYL